MVRPISWCFVAVLGVAIAGCGSDDNATPTKSCEQAPRTLTLKDVSPAADAKVANENIVHEVTVVDAPGVFNRATIQLSPKHTAGTAVGQLALEVLQGGAAGEITYRFKPLTWSTVGHVEFSIAETYLDQAQCQYNFPRPLFSYDVEEAMGGAGGGGGASGGAPGEGGAALGGQGGQAEGGAAVGGAAAGGAAAGGAATGGTAGAGGSQAGGAQGA